MSALAIKLATTSAPDPLDVLELRAWARAYLWNVGEYELAEAVDVLERDGRRDGLDADTVQKILSGAFAPFRGGADE